MCRKDPVGSRLGGGEGELQLPSSQQASGKVWQPADSGGHYILGREIGPVASRLRGITDSRQSADSGELQLRQRDRAKARRVAKPEESPSMLTNCTCWDLLNY